MTQGCGCGCEQTPVPDAERFRYGAILERLLDRLSRSGLPLGRSLDDPAVALLAAAAGAHHVLAWTIHRLAVDSTLPGTEDRAALVRLAGMLGHVPRPPIAAQALLALRAGTLPGMAEPFPQPGVPQVVTVPAGLAVASIPEQGGLPVTFETDAEIEARAGWNALLPVRPLVLPPIDKGTTRIEVEGVTLGARAGDRVLAYAEKEGAGKSAWLLARVTEVEVTAPLTVLTVAGGQLVTAADDLTKPSGPGTVVLLGGRAQAFGAVAPDISFMPEAIRTAYGDGASPPDWKDFVMGKVDDSDWIVGLDAIHPEAAPGRVAVLEETTVQVGRISAAREAARSAFGLSARCTTITLGSDLSATFNDKVRGTTIHLETARGTLVARPADPVLPVTGSQPKQHPAATAPHLADRLYLAGKVDLPPGRQVILTGLAPDGTPLSEAATVQRCDPETAGTLLVLDGPVAGRWRASTLSVLGNVVPASDARSSPAGPETLGSGDPAVALPRYPLSRAPLAYLAAPGPAGYAPAIEVRVADRRYDLAGSLYGEGDDSRRFRVVERPDGVAEVQFAGRLPSGTGTVVARYRSGGGSGGNLPADRLTQVLTPIVGLGTVTNPLRAEGGSDAETLEEMRTAAPKTIRTLDRAVTLADFEAFAQQFRGVGRATAVELRTGIRRIVCVTIATTAFEPPVAGSPLVSGLRDALLAAAAPGTHLRIEGFVDLPMNLSLALAADPSLPRPVVEDAVRQALVRDFGRRVRPFGVAVHRSQVLATVQGVSGVRGAVVRSLTAGDPPDTVTEDALGRLPCPGPAFVPGTARLRPARLLSASAARVTFTELTP